MAIDPIVAGTASVDSAFWLNAAHGAVRRFCGWHVAPKVIETLRVDGRGGKSLLIRSGRIVQVTRVLSDGHDVTDHVDVSDNGTLELRSGCWSERLGGVTVELEHGYELDEVPEVAALIVTLAKRGATGATQQYASQSVNGASVGAFTSGGAPLSVPLLQQEKALLAPYRLGWGA
jgi:hypothetical protein